ncbi:MAG: hypothetical protein Fur0012_02320 [Elusimicrobiota bacterium]
MRERYLFFISVLIAFILWFLTFVIKPFNFWAMMSFNALTLIALASFSKGKILFAEDFTLKNILLGFFSALVLYGIFFFGRKILAFIPGNSQMLTSVYSNGSQTPRWLVAMLLFFPIGFAEEYFWRGWIQKKLYSAYPKFQAVLVASFIYAAVHIPTLNPVLILAAAVCGLYWGILYAISGSISLVIVSHMLWDPLIFVFKQIL